MSPIWISLQSFRIWWKKLRFKRHITDCRIPRVALFLALTLPFIFKKKEIGGKGGLDKYRCREGHGVLRSWKRGVKGKAGGLVLWEQRKWKRRGQMTRKWWNFQGGPHGRLTLTLTTNLPPPPVWPLKPPTLLPTVTRLSLHTNTAQQHKEIGFPFPLHFTQRAS